MKDIKNDPISFIRSELDQIPEGALAAARSGLQALDATDADNKVAALDNAITALQRSGGDLDFEEFSGETGLPLPKVGDLMTAVSITVGLLTQRDILPNHFIEAAIERIFHPDQRILAEQMARLIVEKKPILLATLKKNRLASEVLPSLMSFNVAVDMRLHFSDSDIDYGVPVLVAHVGTDAENRDLWFQMSRTDVDTVIRKLQTAAKRMDIAASLLDERVASGVGE